MRHTRLAEILLGRARADLERVAHELQHGETEGIPDEVADIDEDLIEVRARVDALEARVAAIEERGTE